MNSLRQIFRQELSVELVGDHLRKRCHLKYGAESRTQVLPFDLSWNDPNEQFSTVSDLKSSHLQGLCDLNQKYNVTKPEDVRRLEDLYHAAWGHVNALKALGAERATYQPLAIISMREALPSLLREDVLRKHDADDLEEAAFDDLFLFLKEGIRVRRKSWQMGRH